ncbi:cobaltochelatase CobT-related protein [Vibrio penaeicida]|uniref:cobaltochelatase CobT-related protein n=1 Tax=Vibrio penaeicida TaxID=104609 RepID=UPI000CEA15CC|nr:hypothetical protein [Vibrio penaeicida]
MNSGKQAISQKQRNQQNREHLLATLRSLSGYSDIELKGDRLFQRSQPLVTLAPHLQLRDFGSVMHLEQEHALEDERAIQRGLVDGWVAHLTNTNQVDFLASRPTHQMACWVFDALEQLRVESLISKEFEGMSVNIEMHFEHWSRQYEKAGLLESQVGILLFTLLQMARSRVQSLPIPEIIEEQIESTRMALAPLIGTPLSKLKRSANNQLEYAKFANDIAQVIADLIDSTLEDEGANQPPTRNRIAFDLLVENDGEIECELPVAQAGASTSVEGRALGYQAFTTDYDEERFAASLVRAALLAEFREDLDKQWMQSGMSIRKVAQRMKERFSTPCEPQYQFGEESGLIDGRRLSQIVTSHNEKRVFYTHPQMLKPDMQLTILIDCSGSMRNSIRSVALMVDVLVRAAQLSGIKTEVLGFTTRSWNGGRAQQDWLKARKPKLPGRLNELRHLIFKSASDNWVKSKRQIAAMMKHDLFKEGIDGEAILWAQKRLSNSECQKKALLVISDGCPMDTATQLANDDAYLARHLSYAIAQCEQEGALVTGMGIGLDLSAFYTHHLAVDLDQDTNTKTLFNLIDKIAH